MITMVALLKNIVFGLLVFNYATTAVAIRYNKTTSELVISEDADSFLKINENNAKSIERIKLMAEILFKLTEIGRLKVVIRTHQTGHLTYINEELDSLKEINCTTITKKLEKEQRLLQIQKSYKDFSNTDETISILEEEVNEKLTKMEQLFKDATPDIHIIKDLQEANYEITMLRTKYHQKLQMITNARTIHSSSQILIVSLKEL